MAFLCISQQGEFKNTMTRTMEDTFSRKVEGGGTASLTSDIFFLRFFLSRFFAVSLHEELKNIRIRFFQGFRTKGLHRP
jgi:hypothetical protein